MADSNQPPKKTASDLTPEQCEKYAHEAIVRYQELAIGLREARALLHRGDDRNPDRKLAFLHGLASVIQFLQSTKFFLAESLEEPLVQLLYELQTVASGLPSEDFVVRPGTRARGIAYRAFQMNCALLLENYMSAGVSRGDSCDRIVRIMNKTMSSRTIEDWRLDLSSEINNSDEARRFRLLRDEFSRVIPSVREIDAWASRCRDHFAAVTVKGQMNRVQKKPNQSTT